MPLGEKDPTHNVQRVMQRCNETVNESWAILRNLAVLERSPFHSVKYWAATWPPTAFDCNLRSTITLLLAYFALDSLLPHPPYPHRLHLLASAAEEARLAELRRFLDTHFVA